MNRVMIVLLALLGAASPLLIDSAFKGAAILAVAGLAALVLCRASAATRHLVWVFAVGALLLLPVLSALLPGWSVLPRWTIAPAPAPAPAASSRSVAAPTPSAALGARLPVPSAVIVPAGSAVRLDPEPRLPRHWLDWLPAAWAAGCVLLFARLLAAYSVLWRTTRRSATVQNARLGEMLEAARKRLGIRPQVEARLDARRTIPLIWGVWRPRLLLPAEAVEWNDSQLRSVLLHELAHIKRRDLAVQCLLQAACALHWFNPLVWLAAWRLQAEAERACDDLVLTSGVRASEYAEHVLRVATQFVPARGTPAAGLAMARPSRLEGRLVAVLNERVNRRGVPRLLIWLALAAGLGVVIPVAMLRAAEDPPPLRANSSAAQETPAISRVSPPTNAELARLRLQQAEQELERAIELRQHNLISESEYEKSQREVALRRAELSGDQTEAARVRLQQAESEFKRLTQLRANNVISAEELDQAGLNVQKLKAEAARDPAARASAELEYAKAQVDFAEANFKRITLLFTQKLVSQAERDKARNEVAEAAARLARIQAQQHSGLTNANTVAAPASATSGQGTTSPQKKERVLQLLAQEIQAAEGLAKLTREQYQTGRGTLDTYQQAEMDVLALKREKADLEGDKVQAKELIAREIRLLQELEQLTRQRRESGIGTEADELRVRRQILSLQRQQAELE